MKRLLRLLERSCLDTQDALPLSVAVGVRCSFFGDLGISKKLTHATATGGSNPRCHRCADLKDPSGFLNKSSLRIGETF